MQGDVVESIPSCREKAGSDVTGDAAVVMLVLVLVVPNYIKEGNDILLQPVQVKLFELQ